MTNEDSRKETEQADEKIDVGKYIEKLDNQGNLPESLVKGLKPKNNYNKTINKRDLDDRIRSYIISDITSREFYASGSGWIESEDLILLRAKFMKRSDQGFGNDYAVISNHGIAVKCPFCQEVHYHAVEPEIVLGGVVEYESPCSVDFAPESYGIILRGKGEMPIYKLIQWAKDEMRVDGVPLSQALLPDNTSREELESIHVFGWDSIGEPSLCRSE